MHARWIAKRKLSSCGMLGTINKQVRRLAMENKMAKQMNLTNIRRDRPLWEFLHERARFAPTKHGDGTFVSAPRGLETGWEELFRLYGCIVLPKGGVIVPNILPMRMMWLKSHIYRRDLAPWRRAERVAEVRGVRTAAVGTGWKLRVERSPGQEPRHVLVHASGRKYYGYLESAMALLALETFDAEFARTCVDWVQGKHTIEQWCFGAEDVAMTPSQLRDTITLHRNKVAEREATYVAEELAEEAEQVAKREKRLADLAAEVLANPAMFVLKDTIMNAWRRDFRSARRTGCDDAGEWYEYHAGKKTWVGTTMLTEEEVREVELRTGISPTELSDK